MKKKPETGFDSRRVDSARHDPGQLSRLPSIKYESDDASTEKGWPILRILRGNLMAMNQPLPVSIDQIFELENTFHALQAIPKAVNLQGLERSDTLQAFAFGEADLIRGHESNSKRNACATGKVPPSAWSDKSSRDGALHRGENLPAGGNSEARQQGDLEPTSSSEKQALNQTGIDAQPTAARLPDGDFIAPGFMQQWIEEILAAGTAVDHTAGLNQRSLSGNSQSAATDPRSVDGSRHLASRIVGFPGQSEARSNPMRKKPSSSGAFDNGGRRDYIDTGELAGSSRTERSEVSATAGKSRSGRSEQYPGASVHAVPETSVTVLEGVALLQRLVQAEASSARQEPSRKETAAGVVDQSPTPLGNAGPAKNAAWQQQKAKNPGTVSSLARSDSDNPVDTAPSAVSGNRAGTGYLDESERIAALLNEALAEQALRHGVDLS